MRRALSTARAPVFWLEGVAGAGKTAAVSEYIESGELPCIWLHLDRGDRDPATFFHYLSRAAQPHRASMLPVFSPGRHEVVGFGRHYFERLFDGLRPGTHVVLDDVEQLEPSAALELLSEAVARVPEGVVLLCLSRAAPPPSLARARASGRVCVLGWDALKLDLDETRAFSELFLDAPDANAHAEALYRVSQGWSIGLVLLLGSGGARSLPGAEEPIPACGPLLFDYLSVELYDRFDPDVARILTIVAIPPEVTDTLAVELTGSERARSVLASLAHRNHLVSMREGRQRSYRLHPLFRSFLLARAEQQLGAASVIQLRSRAARALAASGQPEAAAGLFIEAGDGSSLVELIATHAEALLEQGRHDVVKGWCQALSRSSAAREPRVMFWEARALLPLDPPAAGALFRSVYDAAAGAGQQALTFAAWAGAVESTLLGWGSFAELDPWIDALAAGGRLVGGRPARASLCERALGEGIETELVTRWIRRWRFTPRHGGSADWPWPLAVYTLRGNFCVLREGRRITFSGKAQRRPLELLQVLIAFGGEQVSEQRLSEALWPEADGDSAHQALSTTLHRLRKLIDGDSILRSEQRLSLNSERVWVDSLHLGASLTAAASSEPNVLALYHSRFLPQVDAWWAVAQRERLAELFIAHALSLARRRELEARHEEAEHLLRRALEAEPASERLALALERHLSERGEDAAARDARASQRRLSSAREWRAG